MHDSLQWGGPLGLPQNPGFTAGDESKRDYSCCNERLWVLAAALTDVRLGALMSTAVEAALGPGTILAVAVDAAEVSAQSQAPAIPRTHGCGEEADMDT